MPQLAKLIVIHTTKDEEDAGTDADFQLQVVNSSTDLLLNFEQEHEHDQRERGRTDQYEFDVGTMNANSDDPSFSVVMRINDSTDGWVPSSIFVIGLAVDGTSVLIGSHPNWPADRAFDIDEPHVGGHTISGG